MGVGWTGLRTKSSLEMEVDGTGFLSRSADTDERDRFGGPVATGGLRQSRDSLDGRRAAGGLH